MAMLLGVHLTPWMYVAQVRIRWIVVYVGPYRCEWEFVNQPKRS